MERDKIERKNVGRKKVVRKRMNFAFEACLVGGKHEKEWKELRWDFYGIANESIRWGGG